MAKIFDSQQRIVPTWLAALRHLRETPTHQANNLVLEIPDPRMILASERVLMSKVDAALESQGNWPLNSVAGTIFPLDLYLRHGRPDFYQRFVDMMSRGKAPSTWGTYAQRMIARRGRNKGEIINPLDLVVQRISNAGQPKEKSFSNSYELGVAIPEEDFSQELVEVGAELPTYCPEIDRNKWFGFACLSHISLKRVPKGDGHAVNVTAVYRAHHYCERALGNLVGLAQLQWFIAKESKLQVGTLTCVSTYAELDAGGWGGLAVVDSILSQSL
jgi:hypothetical protein